MANDWREKLKEVVEEAADEGKGPMEIFEQLEHELDEKFGDDDRG